LATPSQPSFVQFTAWSNSRYAHPTEDNPGWVAGKLVGKAESVIKVAHSLVHKNVQNEQLKQWMQCMQYEFFLGNLVLVDFKRVGPP
jgi:hypothetical protein